MRNIIKILSLFLVLSFCFADNPVILTYQALFLTAARAPTANETYLTDMFVPPATIQDYPGLFMWIDTADNQIYDYVSGGAGSLVWVARGYSAPARVFTAVTKTLNSASQLSTTRDVEVFYHVDIQVTSTLVSASSGTAFLEYADDSGFTNNVVEVGQGTVASTIGVIALSISVANTATITLTGVIPAGKYVRIRTVTNSGTVSFTSRPGQEVAL